MLKTLKQKTGLEVQENVPLKKLTTMGIGGEARYFIKVNNVHELLAAAKTVIELKAKFFILGGGSNIIVSDSGFGGVVIKNESGEVSIESNEAVVDSGIQLSVLIRKLAELDFGGLEFMMGIPGTLGGAVVNNAGAFGDTISNHLKSITILDQEGEVRIVLKEDLKFSYRSSLFKQISGQKKVIILRVRLILRQGAREEIARKINNYLRLRADQPKGMTCGSYFKNPRVEIIEESWEPIIKDGRIPAGYLLEQINAKGRKEGGVFVSPQHANWIMNKGKGKAEEVRILADFLKADVERKFGIRLEEEIEYIGFENDEIRNPNDESNPN
ncbi:MAG: UDP-N-acetylmuramate dehydrogenase [Candidatus Berkelbacteria bacterium Licking1014_96]|uniref:UDP-N-acetylenolpyruvoylglucosamine reductase n=1 Tax=Candidatus Berkelbacteria bacterium Licking1014_96 TaxID=2017149 RepID=A0A554LH48_9BACT|nr:MAG: UDP-N-acetylmuramate dehydrogenase [Candidatus Berkelbacteria bacterium Licking1014_96]